MSERNQVEQLQPGTGSKDAAVNYVAPQDFSAAALNLRKSRKKMAIYTEAPESRAPLYPFPTVWLPNFKLNYRERHTIDDLIKQFQKARERVYRDRLVPEDHAAYLNFINTLERTTIAIAQQYPNHWIDGLSIFYNPPNGTEQNSHGWHEDSSSINGRPSTAVVATLVGPATEYIGKKGQIITPPDGSMVAHMGGKITHRTPIYNGRHRLTIVIGFVPKK